MTILWAIKITQNLFSISSLQKTYTIAIVRDNCNFQLFQLSYLLYAFISVKFQFISSIVNVYEANFPTSNELPIQKRIEE